MVQQRSTPPVDHIFEEMDSSHQTQVSTFCDLAGGVDQQGIRVAFFWALAKKHPHLVDADMIDSMLSRLLVGVRNLHDGNRALAWTSVVQLVELGDDELGGEELKRLFPEGTWPSTEAMESLRSAYKRAVYANNANGRGF